MSLNLPRPHRKRSPGEEKANSITHGLALLAILAATPYLLVDTLGRDQLAFTIGAGIFAASMVFLYAASTFYHALPRGRFKDAFHKVEHAAIFLLIAGTYTPFGLGVLRGELGWYLLGIIWGLALAGICLKIFVARAHPIIFIVLYLGMGWLLVLAFPPLLNLLPFAGLMWLLAGGIAYTAGLIFFAADLRLRYAHSIWHLFVIVGTSCHYLAVLWYGAGPGH